MLLSKSLKRRPFFLVLLFVGSILAPATAQDTKTIQGAVFKAGSLVGLNEVTIRNNRSNKVSKTDDSGIYSITAMPGDTLVFHQDDFQDQYFVVPNSSLSSIGLMQGLPPIGLSLEESETRFPSQLQFEQSVLGKSSVDKYTSVNNLDSSLNNITNDPTNMQRYIDDYMRWQQMYVLPERGTTNNFINPERWRSFIKDWKNGEFTKEAVERLDGYPALPDDIEE